MHHNTHQTSYRYAQSGTYSTDTVNILCVPCPCAAAASAVNSIYIAELLPTSCRSSVMGICSQASRVGSIAAPFLLMMGAQVALEGHSQVR